MTDYPRIVSTAAEVAPHLYTQEEVCAYACDRILGAGWSKRPADAQQARRIQRLFAASQVGQRRSAVDLHAFYERSRTTGERMAEYNVASYALGYAAMDACLRAAESHSAASVTDFVTVTCTGYGAPGLDIRLARDLGMPSNTRRVAIGHMGCFGALVGIRQCAAAVRAHPGAVAALLSVELSSLHFNPTTDTDMLTSFALFGDAAAAILLDASGAHAGPSVVDTYCAADFASADQMTWTISDHGFIMGLSPRVPITLRRNIAGVVDRLLDPHGLKSCQIAHWLIHPGGPSILDAVSERLELSDEQMSASWAVLRDHGNCSSATVLLILDELVRSGRAHPGEWGVMMAFGPGLTLETCLLRF